MRAGRRTLGLGLLLTLALATGLLAGSSLREAEAQRGTPSPPATLELSALCVNQFTGVVSAPSPHSSTTCPAFHSRLLIPDDFPFILSVNPWTGQITYNPNATPGPLSIVLPDDGTVPLCVSLYTNQLRVPVGGVCPNGASPVFVVGEIAPVAVDDGPYTTLLGATLNEPAPGLLGNDDLGLPAATLVEIDGGDIVGGPVAAGDPTPLAGGMLTVDSDGSFELDTPLQTGEFTFDYLLENAAGSDTATVTIQVQEAPDAADDGPYTTEPGVTLDVPNVADDGLLDNDMLGFPDAEIVEISGGDLTGTFDAGEAADLAGGTLTVNADGSFTLATPTVAGGYSFEYLLENAAGSDTASVTIQVQQAPIAEDDGYTMDVDTTLSVPNVDDDDLLANDDIGVPEAVIVSISGGDLPGTTSAGDPAAFAGGTLTVEADGSFTLVDPDETGEFTFDYLLENVAGSDTATVTIEVQGPPDAMDDGPEAADSEPGDPFHTAFETTLDSTQTAADDNLLANDDPGFPEGAITFFGPGLTTPAGTPIDPLPEGSGSLTVNADGSFVFTPPDGFTGEYTFDYRLENTIGFDDATVTIAVGVRPEAMDDSYGPTVLGNVSIDTSTDSDFSVLANDQGDALTFTSTSLTSAAGGDVVLNADGTFEYDPPPGFEGSDTFDYEINNGFNEPQTGTVSLTVDGMIWFIDQDADENGDGRLSAPFDCLVAGGTACFDALASDDAGDSVFLASGAYTGGLTLLDDQIFAGEGAAQTLSQLTGLTPPADSPMLPGTGGIKPQITTSNVDAFVLGNTNAIVGLSIGNTGTGTAITGTNFGTFVASDIAISGTGQALNLTTGEVLAVFESIESTGADGDAISLSGITSNFPVEVLGTTTISNPSGHGIAIDASPANFDFQDTVTIDNSLIHGINLTGSSNGSITFASVDLDFIGSVGLRVQDNDNPVTINGGSIGATNDPGGNAVDIDGGTANITVAASVNKTTGGDVVNVAGRSGGIATFSGAVSCTGTCSGIDISSNTSGTTTVTGAATVSTGAMTAVNLTNNGGHTIAFSGGLTIDTTAGAGFNATGSGTVEVLDDSVTNTVDSTTGTAVNIANVTIGANGVTFERVSANGGTNGIVLTNTGTQGGLTVTGDGSMSGGVLDRDGSGGTIASTTGSGILLTGASNVTLQQMNITGSGAHAVESTSGANHVLSAVTIQNSSDHGWHATNLDGVNRIDHGSALFVPATTNTDGIRFDATGSNFTSFTLDNVTVTGSATGNDGFFHRALGSTSGNIIVTDSLFTAHDGDGVQVANDGSGLIDVTVQSNTFQTADSTNDDGNNGLALNLGGTGTLQFQVGGPDPLGNMFTDVNRLGDNSGVINITAAGAGTGPTSRLIGTVENNSIENSTGRRGISVLMEASGGGAQGGHSITIVDNSIQNVAREGILVNWSSVAGADNTGNDLTIQGNQVGDVSVVSNAGNREGIDIEGFHDGSGGGVIEANILVQNNVVRTDNTDETFRLTNDAFGGGTTDLEATVLGNTFTNLNAGGDSFEVVVFDAGSATSLDLNSANVAGARNSSNRGYILDHRSGGASFEVEVDPGDATVNTPGATYTDAQIEAFFNARNDDGTVATPENQDDFLGVAAVTLPS